MKNWPEFDILKKEMDRIGAVRTLQKEYCVPSFSKGIFEIQVRSIESQRLLSLHLCIRHLGYYVPLGEVWDYNAEECIRKVQKLLESNYIFIF